MEQHTQICTNCSNTFAASFCNQCGQKITHRYTIGHVLHELAHVFTHADKGIFSFAWNIIRRPGTVALDLVEGRRKRYFNLFQYLILIVGVSTFLMTKTHYLEVMMKTRGSQPGQIVSERVRNFQLKSGLFMQEHFNLILFILIPLFSFFTWLITKRGKYNYAETLVLHTSINSGLTTVSMVSLMMLFIVPAKFFTFYNFFSLVLMLFYFAIGYIQFYKKSFLRSLLYALFSIVCTYLVFTLLVAVIVVVYIIITNAG